jgi:hypothetical protein
LTLRHILRLGAKGPAWLLLSIIIVGLLSLGPVRVRGADGASASIGDAETALRQAFGATLDAERAGANVTGLLSRLDESGLDLSMAEAASNGGNDSGAAILAGASKTLADGVATDALALESSAAGWFSSFSQAFETGLVGAGLFVVVLLLAWRWFKRYYNRKLLGSRPGVTA